MNSIVIRQLGTTEYSTTFNQQKAYTLERAPDKVDELWCLQHSPVYTLGLAGKAEHILNARTIPVQKSDRGGQVTYHGPGQLVIYPLIDLKRINISIRHYVYLLEQAVIRMLDEVGIAANRKDKAPGVYVDQKKIAALGIRVRGGCCYHGLSLNVDMDLTPFQGINPCGYPFLEVTQLSDCRVQMSVEQAGARLIPYITTSLGFDNYLDGGSSVMMKPTETSTCELA